MADDGSNFGGSVRGKVSKMVRSRYLIHMEPITSTVKEGEKLMILENLYAKLHADQFEHFVLMAKGLAENHGILTPFESEDQFFQTAVYLGWDGGDARGDQEVDMAKEVLLQQDRSISSILLSKMGPYSSLAFSHPLATVGRSVFLLRGLFTKLQPPSTSGLSTGILWGTLDHLLNLEQPPSRLHFDLWISKLDLHLISMETAGQKASDAQIVGRVLSQLQRFTQDRWCSRAENLSAHMLSDESKTWASLKSRLLEFSREDARVTRMNQTSAALYLSDDKFQKPNAPFKKSERKPPTQTEIKCSYCGKANHTFEQCRKRISEEAASAGKKTTFQVDKQKPKMGGTQIVALAASEEFQIQKKYALDSGATVHAVCDRSSLTDIRDCNHTIQGIGGKSILVKEIGTMTLKLQTDTGGEIHLQFEDVFYSQEFSFNLISVSKLLEKGHTIVLTSADQGISLQDRDENQFAWIPIDRNSNGLFCLTEDTVVQITSTRPLPLALPLVSNSSELDKLKETSDSAPSQFLTNTAQPYKVSEYGTIPSFAHPSPVTGFGTDGDLEKVFNKVPSTDPSWVPTNEEDSDSDMPELVESESEDENESPPPRILPPRSGGKKPAVKNKTKPQVKEKPQNFSHNTRSKGTVLVADKSNAEEKCQEGTCDFEELKIKSDLMLYTAANSFGMPAIDSGLGISGKNWYELYTGYLLELGFTQAGEEGTIFHINSNVPHKLETKEKFKLTLAVYVDDSIMSFDNLSAYKELIAKLDNRFKISHEEDASSFLGSKITYDMQEGVLTITQEKFVTELLKNFQMENSTPISTPMDSKLILSKNQQPPEELKDLKTVKSFQCLIGSLMWLTSVCRPDLAYSTTKLARYASNPGQIHIQAGLRVLRYLSGTRTLGLCYRADQKNAPDNMLNADPKTKICFIPRETDGSIPLNRLFAYADASNLDDYDTCRSTTGMLVFHCGLVAFGLRLIKIILLSTTEAEYHALSEAIKLIMYLRTVLEDIGSAQTTPTPLGEDNEGCLHLAVENRHAFDRTRHMAARRLWVIQGIKEKIVEIKKCPTLEMLADFLTKPQPKDLFLLHRKSIMGM